ncbi:MAG: hypothetical protein VCD00_07935 [Candidatus Hydrogenedentota bacterium]
MVTINGFRLFIFVGIPIMLSGELNTMAQADNSDAPLVARQALETFMTKWNTGDDEQLRTAMNFPFVTFIGGSRVIIHDSPKDSSQGFDRMRERDGWDHSSFDYDSMEIFMSSAEKVHLSIDYSRFKADGERYSTGNVFYAITKQEEHWGVQMRSPVGKEVPAEKQTESIADARAAVVGYMEAFNAGDGAQSDLHLNFPHLFMMGGRVSESSDTAAPNFERMRESQNWHVSTLDSLEASIVTPNKVHFEVVFSRWHPDGTRYWTVPALWIVTKNGDHWGIQLRSLMPATFSDQ